MTNTPAWQPPQFCDYLCPHAEFARPDASGACRREQAVWCNIAKKHNNKNAKCLLPRAGDSVRPVRRKR